MSMAKLPLNTAELDFSLLLPHNAKVIYPNISPQLLLIYLVRSVWEIPQNNTFCLPNFGFAGFFLPFKNCIFIDFLFMYSEIA